MTHHSAPTRGEVTQGDREAAAKLIDARPLVDNADIIRHGGADDSRFVQAFADHRLAAIEECAKVAETLDMGQSWSTADTCSRFHTRNAIAQAIRNLGRGA